MNPGARGTQSFTARVGNDGFVDSRSYGDGFAKAVDILTSALDSNDHRGQLDTLIYPICFCARQHVEVFLTEQIVVIRKMRGSHPPFRYQGSTTWAFFGMASSRSPRKLTGALSPPLDGMKTTILDIAQIDTTGQTFRYPTNMESAKHLVQTPVINVPTLRREFIALVERIAERLGIGPEAVSRLERGSGSIAIERLVVLSEMFGCRSDQLLLRANSRPEDQSAALD